MPRWAPFLAVVAILVVVLLLLAHKSQQILHEHAETAGGSSDERAGVSTAERGSVTGESPGEATSRVPDSTTSLEPGTETGSDAPVGETTMAPDTLLREQAPMAGDGPTDREPAHQHGAQEIVLTPGVLLANVAFTQALVAAILVGAAWYFSIPASAFGLEGAAVPNSGVGVGLGVAFGAALWVGNELATVMADAVGAAYDETVRQMLAPESAGGWAFLFGAVLPLIAVAEELLFRAALIGAPAAGFEISPWLLAVVSSVAFAFGHGAQGRVGIVVTGLLGLALAMGFVLTGSLLVVVVAHYVINALEFLVHEFLGIKSLYGTSS